MTSRLALAQLCSEKGELQQFAIMAVQEYNKSAASHRLLPIDYARILKASLKRALAACESCGAFKKTGQLSCCALGGTWFDNCGPDGDSNSDHTWLEGIQACQSEFTIYG